MKKILITGGKSAQTLKLLKGFPEYDCILGDYGDMPSISTMTYRFLSLGIRNDETIAHTLLTSCLDQTIDIILPVNHFEIEPVSKSSLLFEEFGIDVLLPDTNTLKGYLSNEIEDRSGIAIYERGALIYASGVADLAAGLVGNNNLHGAFYVGPSTLETGPTLFTI